MPSENTFTTLLHARHLTWARCCLVVAVVALVTHASALRGGFIWLDHAHLEQRLALADLGDLPSLLSGGFAGTGFYRPLMGLSLSLDAAFGGSPWLFHTVTLAWHAGAAIMVVLAARALGLGTAAGLLGGLIFAVHPLTSLVAGAIAFRSEAMLAVALLALVVCHLRGARWGAALSLVAAGLCKETGLVLGPLFVVALELSARSGQLPTVRPPLRRTVFVAEVLALGLVVLLRAAYAPEFRARFPPMTVAQALGTRLASVAKSSQALFVVGWDRSICDAFPLTPLVSVQALSGLVLVLALSYVGWRRRGAALLFALALLPSLALVPLMRWWSPHYLYVALAFGALAVAELAVAAFPGKKLLWAGLPLALAGSVTFVDDARFRSDDALWSSELARSPQCREAHFYWAEGRREQKQWQAAAEHYERAVAEYPKSLSYVDLQAAYANLGVVRLEQRRGAEARRAFQRALELTRDANERRQMTHNLATAALVDGDARAAVSLLQAEVARPDALPQSRFVYSQALEALRRQPP